MHIAFSGRITPPITGAELVPIKILRELSALDKDNQYSIFLSEKHRDILGYDAPNLNIITYDDFWSNPIGSVFWHQVLLPTAVKRHKIDILYTVHNRLPVIKNCPQVVNVLDLADYHVEQKYDALRSVYRRLVSKLVVPRADRVVTISESSKRDIVEFLHIPQERVDVIYLGVGEEFFTSVTKRSAREVVAERLGIASDYILYVGALEHPNKNLVRLLQAYDLARRDLGVTQTLVMAGPKRYQPEVIMAEIERLGLHDFVHCLGYVPKEDLPYLYAAADLFAYVSLWEGFGLPVLEAMAGGTPVIASNTSSLPEVVGDAGILVDPLSVPDIATAIEALLHTPELQQRLVHAGVERAKTFTWANSAQNMLHVFEAIGREIK